MNTDVCAPAVLFYRSKLLFYRPSGCFTASLFQTSETPETLKQVPTAHETSSCAA
jgi:hypothetical protein